MSTENSTENDDTIEANDIKISEPLHWDGLINMQASIVNAIMNQQALVLELSKKFESVLNNDPGTFAAVDGLMKSIHDIAIGVSQLQAQHKIKDVFRVGVATGEDEILDYLRIGAGYISAEENLANMMATAYLDIFTRLSVDTSQIEEMSEVVAETKVMTGSPDVK